MFEGGNIDVVHGVPNNNNNDNNNYNNGYQQQKQSIQHYLFNKSTEPNHFIKALPSPSPLVTPEMGERLCRMSSQHQLSLFDPYHLIENMKNKELISVLSPPPFESLTAPTTLLPLPTIINPTPAVDQAFPINFQSPDPPLEQPNPISISQSELIPINTGNAPDSLPHPLPVAENPNQLLSDQNSIRNSQSVPQNLNVSPIDPSLMGSPHHHSDSAIATNGTPSSNHALVKVQSIKTSQTHPMNISPVIPPDLTAGLMFMLKTANHRVGSNKLPIDLFDLTGSESNKAIELFWQYHHQRLSHNSPRDGQTGMQESAEGGKLGNLLLSSCPGKKVRMNETAAQRQAAGNHRSPICRDLKSDLSRAHSIGIRAIICCLDDEELEYLGSPWPEYSRISLECGLSVIRIPIAEGFAPQNGIKEVNEVLDEVIKNYTVLGIDVLCHCRGGVGRAGLVACCWMLKIGLINKPSLIADPSNHTSSTDCDQSKKSSFDTSNYQDQYNFHQSHHQHQHQQHHHHPQVPGSDIFSFVDGHQLAPKNSVLGQVEKVIEVIRRRRRGGFKM
ncbi:hypothetical protein VP01_1852g4 [Puccinia sorghi]|uniref:Tyrosine specific protein phosphatases domain-containing protein n=1 Tax=Puccinia sorghi TaxID=27349 RepID=A0A0L6VE65_9BASI|nr:hypothetical protein VP01_1852g4 [Puccinia sorghi]